MNPCLRSSFFLRFRSRLMPIREMTSPTSIQRELSTKVSVHCRCGEAYLTSTSPIRCSLYCSCNDCRQKAQWSFSTANAAGHYRLLYLENTIDSFRGDFRRLILRDTGESTFLVTNCCQSILAIDHSGYLGNVFMVITEAAGEIRGTCLEPLARIYAKDWKGALDPIKCPTFQCDGNDVDQARVLYRPKLASPALDLAANACRLQDVVKVPDLV